MDFVLNSERKLENVKYVYQWIKEQYRNSLYEEDILHLIVEDIITKKTIGYLIKAGVTNKNRNIEFKRIIISSKEKWLKRLPLKI